jgi:hypothetical protein
MHSFFKIKFKTNSLRIKNVQIIWINVNIILILKLSIRIIFWFWIRLETRGYLVVGFLLWSLLGDKAHVGKLLGASVEFCLLLYRTWNYATRYLRV